MVQAGLCLLRALAFVVRIVALAHGINSKVFTLFYREDVIAILLNKKCHQALENQKIIILIYIKNFQSFKQQDQNGSKNMDLCFSCFRVCSLLHCRHLLGKGCPLGSCF